MFLSLACEPNVLIVLPRNLADVNWLRALLAEIGISIACVACYRASMPALAIELEVIDVSIAVTCETLRQKGIHTPRVAAHVKCEFLGYSPAGAFERWLRVPVSVNGNYSAVERIISSNRA